MISLLLVYIGLWYTSVTNALAYLQQVSYRSDKYQKDLKKGWWFYPYRFTLILFLCYGCYMIHHQHMDTIYLLLLMCIAFYFYRYVQTIKKRQTLKYTPRCLRLMIMLYIILLLMLIWIYHLCSIQGFILLTPLLYHLPYFMIMIALKLMHPIEASIAQYYYDAAKEKLASHQHIHRIGISGSAGKTSVKNILSHCLKDDFYVLSTPYSYNTAMGISKTINEQLNHLHEYFICECGIDHPNEMDEIVSLIEPNDVILTPIYHQHLATMKTRSNILKEKFKLAKALKQDDLLVCYGDDESMRLACKELNCQIIFYGKDHQNGYYYQNMIIDEEGTSFQIVYQDKAYDFTTRLYGEHAVSNICSVVAFLHEKGIAFERLQERIKTLDFIPHRLEKKIRKDYILLDDAYNANPQGARYALEVLAKMPGKKIVITSGFVELGSEQVPAQYAFGIQACSCCDEIILIGEKQCAPILDAIEATGYDFKHVHLCQNMNEALSLAQMLSKPQTYVLIENDLPDHYLL